MDFLHPELPQRMSLVKASLRTDKNCKRYLRVTFAMKVGRATPWLPRFIKKEVLADVCDGNSDRVRFAGELDHVNAHFSKLADLPSSQSMMDVAVNGFELRGGEDGVSIRFGFETDFGPDVSAWLAECFGADVFLRCESAQPDLPIADGNPRRKDRQQDLPPAANLQ